MSDDLRERAARAIFRADVPTNMVSADWDSSAILGAENSCRKTVYRMADAALAEMGGVQNQLDEAINQLDSARNSVDVLERRLAEMGGVRVKPLVWDVVHPVLHHSARNILGKYICSKTNNAHNDRYMVTYLTPTASSETIGYIDGIEAAKAAAQADYEARILAAIEPAPVSVREAARVLLGHTPKITAKPLAEMSEAMKIDAHPAILLRGFCAALRAIAGGKE